MPLFVAHLAHPPETCPAVMAGGAELLAHVSAANAALYGVAIQAEAVVDGSHEMVLILDSIDRDHVDRFLAFFTGYGTVRVSPASAGEAAVARGGCAQPVQQLRPPASVTGP